MSAVREVQHPDHGAAVALLQRAGFGPTVDRLVSFPLRSPHGALLGIERDGAMAAVAGAVSFGATGWLGAVAVAPEHRRDGLGRAIVEAAAVWLRERGARTILLYATEAGRPLYESLGFEAEYVATAWRGVAAVRLPAPVRPLTAADRDAFLALDRLATGEDRSVVWPAGAEPTGWAVDGERPGAPRGIALASPYSRGIAVAAHDPEAGVALLACAASGPAAGIVLVPDVNEPACEALRRWRFTTANAPLRMRLGPAPERLADAQYGLFNFFWG